MKKLLTILILLCSLSSFGQFGLFQAHNRYSTIDINYGYLYNRHAAVDARNIANDGWSVPSQTQIQILADYLGASGDYTTSNTIGGKLKDTLSVYWDTPNSGATNEVKFNGRGSGNRSSTGVFAGQLTTFRMWSTTVIGTGGGYGELEHDQTYFRCTSFSSIANTVGLSIRPVKDSTTLSDGESGTYTGNDGKVYRTICIGTQEWVADNIAETKYRNGDSIPEVTDGTTWSGLTTGARCVYDNDENNR